MQEDPGLPRRLAEPSDKKRNKWSLGRRKGVFGKEAVVWLLKSKSPRRFVHAHFSLV